MVGSRGTGRQASVALYGGGWGGGGLWKAGSAVTLCMEGEAGGGGGGTWPAGCSHHEVFHDGCSHDGEVTMAVATMG